MELSAHIVEKVAGKIFIMLAEIEDIMGSYIKNKSREGTTHHLTLLIQFYLISILDRAESEHKELSLELLSIVYEMTKTDSVLADRFRAMSKQH